VETLIHFPQEITQSILDATILHGNLDERAFQLFIECKEINSFNLLNSKLSDFVIQKIANLPNLMYLNLKNCKQISSSTVSLIFQKCNRLLW